MSSWGKVLITGASGFIGRRLRAALVEEGADVLALVRRGSPPPASGARTALVDYEDPASLAAVIEAEPPAYVFHVAGVTKGVALADFRRGNVVPTHNLLAALRQAGAAPERFVHLSSLAAYGPSAPERPVDERSPKRPVEHYGQSKQEAEAEVEDETRIPWTIIRPAGVYGPGDVDFFNLFQIASRGMNVFFGNRRRIISLVHVDDLVRAIMGAARAPAARNKGYFICDGRPVTFDEFQAQIAAASGRRVRDLDLPEVLVSIAAAGGELLTRLDGKARLFNRQKALMGRQDAWSCTHAAAAADFGYAPQIPLERGVPSTFAWYRESGWL